MEHRILLVNGPNLNLLGSREPDKYGNTNLQSIEDILQEKARESGYKLNAFQSNHEGQIIDFIHQHGPKATAMIINPGAFTHSSIAIRDAILGVKIPFIEVHITNVYQREAFRHQSFFKDISIGQIVGLGTHGYLLALESIIQKIKNGDLAV